MTKYNRKWHQERGKNPAGGTNVRGNKHEKHERSKVKAHTRKVNGKTIRVKSYYRHKGRPNKGGFF